MNNISLNDVASVAPALAAYTQDKLHGELWARPGLVIRDRCIVTLSVLIARNQSEQMTEYLDLALDNGVEPGEISEIITHLAFYSGWQNALSAVGVVQPVFRRRGIQRNALPSAMVELLPLNEAAERQRAITVEQNFGAIAPGVVQYTTELLFQDLLLRPARAMDNGLTRTEAAEMLTHLAFYAGWPNVFSALPVVKDVFARNSV